jgi:hypothetical protein
VGEDIPVGKSASEQVWYGGGTMSTRFLTEHPLKVAAELRGAELASPLRRTAAFVLDFVVLVIPSLIVALGAATLALAASDPKGLAAVRTLLRGKSIPVEARHGAFRDLAPLLARLDAQGLPREVHRAVEDGDLDRAAAILEQKSLIFAMAMSESTEPHVSANHVRFPIERLIPAALRGLTFYGVAAVYFSLFTASRRGATLGKRLLRIRVARLDGHRLTLVESLERFVGYLHIPASLFLSLVDFWRDPNRRLPHDRVVHTAVLRNAREGRQRS